MPTQIYDTPQIRERISQAKRDVGRIRDMALEFNVDIEGLISLYMKQIRYAILSHSDYTHLISELEHTLNGLIDELLKKTIQLACEREGYDYNIFQYILPMDAPQCSLGYYADTMARYKSILIDEITFAVDGGYVDDLTVFLDNPTAYMSDKKGGLLELTYAVSEAGRGVSYSFSENMKKLGISVAALSYANAVFSLWKRDGNIVGYFGVRNSSYPCPLCDSYANVFIPISQGMQYPLHNRCVCSVVPLYQNELS